MMGGTCGRQRRTALFVLAVVLVCIISLYAKSLKYNVRTSTEAGTYDATTTQKKNVASTAVNASYYPEHAAAPGNSAIVHQMWRVLQELTTAESDVPPPQRIQPCLADLWKACIPSNCSRSLSEDHFERLWDLLSPKLRLSDEESEIVRNMTGHIPANDVIVVSATSENHYNETQSMIHNLHSTVYPRVRNNMTFILFDLGLTEGQRIITQKACQCHLIQFPINSFPNFSKEPGCYTWKPMIVLASIMKARKFVVYQDASIRWNDLFPEVLERADKLGIQVNGNNRMHNIPVATMKGTFDFMGDQPCAYLPYRQLESGVGVFKNDPFVLKTVLEPWAKCGFIRECFCPTNVPTDRNCRRPEFTGLHRCHRYDQSALSVIVTKLFGNQRYRFHMPDSDDENKGRYFVVKRHQREPTYFNELIAKMKSSSP